MTFGEAWRLTQVLLTDPGSQVAAAVAGWENAASRESLALYDLYDLQHQSKAKRKPQPYPRPWVKKPRHIGGASMSADEFRAIKDSIANR